MRQSQVVACYCSPGRWFGDVRRCGGPRVQEQNYCKQVKIMGWIVDY